MKHAETFLPAHTDSDAEMPFGRGNAVGHVQRMRIEVLVAPNVADALEGGITGGIAAIHARDFCLDARRITVEIRIAEQIKKFIDWWDESVPEAILLEQNVGTFHPGAPRCFIYRNSETITVYH